MKRYEDKKVVIIGGTSGMGLATAKMLLDGRPRTSQGNAWGMNWTQHVVS